MNRMTFGRIPTMQYACTEAFNTLASNITFAGSQYKVIMLTSCIANEGKSFVSFSTACALANMGYRTVLVDADLRKSVFMSNYDVHSDVEVLGLTHYLAGKANAADILYQTNIWNVYVIPIGRNAMNSLSLLTSSSFPELLKMLRNEFDFVIVDSPPVGLIIDAAMIASTCDATILVVAGELIARRELVEAKRQLEKSGCMILGTVLNKVSMDTHKSKKYYYKSYYSNYYVSGNETGGQSSTKKSEQSGQSFLRKPKQNSPV